MKPATTTTLLLVVVIVIMTSSSLAAPTPVPRSEELVGATREMERANYFTFVMLINMCPPSLFPPNVTFLMPNDRLLAAADGLSPDTVPAFLLRHSIPSPLLFDTLRLLPSGSVLPSAQPAYSLTVANGGPRSYVINNVRLVSPNICSNSASTVRCHGIDGVLSETSNHTAPACPSRAVHDSPSPSPSPGYEYVGAAPASQGSPVMMPPPPTKDSSSDGNSNKTIAVVPSPAVSEGGGRVVMRAFVVGFVVLVSTMMLLV